MKLTISILKIANASSFFTPISLHIFNNMTPENILDCFQQIDESISDLTKYFDKIPVELDDKYYLELSVEDKSLTIPLHNFKLETLEHYIFNVIYLPNNTIKSIRFLRKNKVGAITFYQINNEFALRNKLIAKSQDDFSGIAHLIEMLFKQETANYLAYQIKSNSYEIVVDTLKESYSLISFNDEQVKQDCEKYLTETVIKALNARYNSEK